MDQWDYKCSVHINISINLQERSMWVIPSKVAERSEHFSERESTVKHYTIYPLNMWATKFENWNLHLNLIANML